MKLEVLVATMNQSDCQLAEKMNMCGAGKEYGVILANQANRNEIVQEELHGTPVKMISTTTKGVGLNRNIALLASTAEVVLFADDDVTYYDGFQEQVCEEFKKNSKADVIIFSLHVTKNGQIIRTVNGKRKRLYLWNALKFGTCVIAVRKNSLLKNRICFSQLFGGGCMYSSGEDSLFIGDCLKSGLRIYACDFVLGKCAKDTSTWFSGYHNKFFYDKGVLIACMFPRMKGIMKWYFALRFLKLSELSFKEIMNQINAGMKGYKNLNVYSGK